MKIKKVLVLCFSDNLGGMELDAIRFCRRLSNFCEVTFVAPKGSEIEKEMKIDREDKGSYKFIACKLKRFLARSLIDPSIVTTVRSEAKSAEPDLVVFFGTSEIKSIAAALIGVDTKLLMRIGTTINRPKKNIFQRIFYKRVDAFIATSEHIKHNIKRVFPVASNRIVKVCFPVVDTGSCSLDVTANSNIIKIIYHSRFVRGKGQIDAVKAFHSIFHSVVSSGLKVELTLIGSFEDQEYLQEIKCYVINSGLTKVVHILPSRPDVHEILHDYHIYLGPSYGEGFSNSFVEALSNYLICVVYDNTVFPYFRHLGFDFLMAPTGDVEILSQRLAQSIDLYVNKRIDVQSNSALVGSLFSAAAERAVLEDIYSSLNRSS